MKNEFDTLSYATRGDHVALVMLNRPDALNAMNTRMGEEVIELFEELAMRPGDIRCVVLTGAGERAFCAGGDLKQREGMSTQAWMAQHLVFERMMRALIDCPLPLLAAVNGVAYGGGCEIAGCCDFIYAVDSARFALPEVKLGIMPGGGGTQTMPRAMGERRAKELLLTGRPFTAQQAMQWGLVNEVFPAGELMERALETAVAIAGNAPISTKQIKQSISRGMRMSLADGLAFEIEAYNRMVPTQDRIEGVKAFNEKRKPVFKGL
jgi:enoyl-CoA hydratase/carnithine racemase